MGIKHYLINGLVEINTHAQLNIHEFEETFHQLDNGVKAAPMNIAITETTKNAATNFLVYSVKETINFNDTATDLYWREKPYVEEVSPGIWAGRCRLLLLDLSGAEPVVLVGDEA